LITKIIFNQLTTNPNGTKWNIDDIEEIFLSRALSNSAFHNQPIPIETSLSAQIVELN